MGEWSTSYVNDLKDDAFLFIESGGEKDEQGKTKPRSLRHFPVKDKDGKVDVAHARNAIARIPQSNAPGLSAGKKSELQDKARRLLEHAEEKTMTTKETLDKVEKMLAQIVGVQKRVLMTPEQFIGHAMSEISKAQVEKFDASRARLEALHKSVLYSSDIIENTEADGLKIPVFVIEQTTFGEQENQVMSPAAEQVAGEHGGETVFEDGMMTKRFAELGKLLAEMSKYGELEEETDAQGKKGPKKPAEKAGMSEGDTAAAEEEEKKKRSAAAKADKSADDALWPDDMNSPAFVEKGEARPQLDWGHDSTK